MASLTTATATFLGFDGEPRRPSLIFALEMPPTSLGGGEYLLDETPLVVQANELGILSVELVRGAKVRVAIEGTTYSKVITVPDVETFDLLQVLGDSADAFTIQTLPPLVSRRSF